MGATFRVSHPNITNVLEISQLRGQRRLPHALDIVNHNAALEAKVRAQLARRLETLANGMRSVPLRLCQVAPSANAPEDSPERELADLHERRKDVIEMGNRLPEGSVFLLEDSDYFVMTPNATEAERRAGVFVSSPRELLDLAQEGAAIIKRNSSVPGLATVARGVPVGGAATRAVTRLTDHPREARELGVTPDSPRFLYPVLEGSRRRQALLRIFLENNLEIMRYLGVISPNLVMTNHEISRHLARVLAEEITATWTDEEKESTLVWNQHLVQRFMADPPYNPAGEKLYPPGHGNYPMQLAEYSLLASLRDAGVSNLVFSNADEFMWACDPVMVAIADRLFKQGYTGLAVVVPNTNNQFGGGPVKDRRGNQKVVETPRLPWSIVEKGEAPKSIYTTFCILNVGLLAEQQESLLKIAYSLTVKTAPKVGGQKVAQIVGADSWAGDIFTAFGRTAFVFWPRRNFLGIKDSSHICGRESVDYLDGLSYRQYVGLAAQSYWPIIKALLKGNQDVATRLFRSDYDYLAAVPK